MTYERLAYDDADTVEHMHDDADHVVEEMHLPKQTTVANAVETVTGLAHKGVDLAADTAEAAAKRVVTVSQEAARLATKLLPF